MAKPIRIIDNPDKQRPDKWSSTVYPICEKKWVYEFYSLLCIMTAIPYFSVALEEYLSMVQYP